MKRFFLKKIKPNSGFCIITLIYLLIILYMLPLYNQTYNDDFAYIQSVRDYLQTGNFRITDWAGASLVFPMFWGALFSKLFGYSPATLIFSTVVLLYPGLVCFYLLLKRLGQNEFRSTGFTLFLLGFPWVLQFTYTFQTDIPYMSLMIISLFFFTAAIQSGKNSNFLLGSLFAGLAYLTRQLGSSLILSIFLVLFLKWKLDKKMTLQSLLASLGPFLIFVIPYQFWLSQPGNAPYSLELQSSPDWFKNELFPNLFPIDLNYFTGTNRYYAKFIYRSLLYFHHLVALLLPFFLFFKFQIKTLLGYLRKHKIVVLISILSYYLLFSIEYFLHYEDSQFTFLAPDRITIWSSFLPFDFAKVWQAGAILGSPIFAALLGVSINKLVLNFFKASGQSLTKITKLIIFVLPIMLVLLWCKVFTVVYATLFTYSFANHSLINQLGKFLNLVISPVGLKFLHDSWLVLVTWWLVVAGVLVFYRKFRLLNFKKSCIKLRFENLFIILVFAVHFFLIVFLGNVHVPQYILSFLPFALIWLAFISKNWQMNYILGGVMLVILLCFSTQITKNRFVNNGIRFEMGTKLVEHGVEPYLIEAHEWSWLPWWYYESTLASETHKVGGDKYKVKELGTFYIYSDMKIRYSYLEVPVDFNPTGTNLKIVLDSGNRYVTLFSRRRELIIERD